jgi:hypothetical protein
MTAVSKGPETNNLVLDDYVSKILAEAPPLNDEQRVRLAELLRPVRGGQR